MIAVANLAVLFLLSLFGPRNTAPDPHGLHEFSRDPVLRQMLVEGRFQEFSAAVDGFLGVRLSIDLSKNSPVNPSTVRKEISKRSDLGGFFDVIKTAIAVAGFAAELKSLGPVKGFMEAIHWLESGLVRKSELKRSDFPAYYSIVSKTEKGSISEGQMEALGEDILFSQEKMDSAYKSLFGRLTETFY